MSDIPRIVILGLSKSGKKTLLQGISRYLEFDYNQKIEHKIECSAGTFECYASDVITKYYKAPIEIAICSGENARLTEDDIKKVVDHDCQGVILLCNSYDSKALETIKKWEDIIKTCNDNYELKLVVMSHNDIQNAVTAKNTSSIKEWCIDNYYELVPCNLRLPYLTWKEQDKEGVARVVEDLECVMWSSMDMSVHREKERVIEETPIISSNELEECAYCHKSKITDGIRLYLCSRCKLVSYCSKECQVKDWKNHKAFCNQVAGIDPAKKAKEAEEKRLKEAERHIQASLPPMPKSKEDEDLDRFAQLLNECRATKANANNLPDSERKRRAAEITAKIMRELDMGTAEEISQIENDLKDTKVE